MTAPACETDEDETPDCLDCEDSGEIVVNGIVIDCPSCGAYERRDRIDVAIRLHTVRLSR